MRTARWLAAAVTLAICATACTSAVGSAPLPAPTTLAGYYAQRLGWQPCYGGFQCAQLVVPFDYARPDGPRFTLPVVKLSAADPSHRIGALVINPGGPGVSGAQYALAASDRLFGSPSQRHAALAQSVRATHS